jgi:DNA-binding NtrC family response regulator
VIGLADFQAAESSSSASSLPAAADSDHADPPIDARNGPSLKEQVEAFERGLVGRALDSTGGNQSEAARRLGVSRVTLIDKMKKYSLNQKR